jgi:hypothetical protein
MTDGVGQEREASFVKRGGSIVGERREERMASSRDKTDLFVSFGPAIGQKPCAIGSCFRRRNERQIEE